LPQGYALIRLDDYAALVAQSVPMRVLARDPRRVFSREKMTMMTASAFAFLLTGVLLNAGAQLCSSAAPMCLASFRSP
jgi:hypothetical protein